jgi:hypothetical protein
MAIDERTNSIVVKGAPEDLKLVEALLQKIDEKIEDRP